MKYFLLLTITILTGCQPYDFKDKKLINTISADEIKPFLVENRLISKNSQLFGLKTYQLVYRVQLPNRQEVNASAIVVVPSKMGVGEQSLTELSEMKRASFATVIDNHSTIIDKDNAPSIAVRNYNIPRSALLFSAMNGFITLIPDYVGYGSSAKLTHPYFIKNFPYKNSLALLRAYKSFCKAKHININLKKGLFMVGYSEGGYISLATLDALNKKSYKVSLTIAGAAPYFLDTMALNSLKSSDKNHTLFIAYTIYSYAKYYKDINLNKIINSKYLSKFSAIFDSNLTKEQIKNSLPTKLYGESGLLKEDFIQNFETSKLYQHLKENSLKDINPKDSIKLFHCKHDTLIPYKISQQMQANLENKGATSTLHNVEINLYNQKTNHQECGIYTYVIAAKIFTRLRLILLGY